MSGNQHAFQAELSQARYARRGDVLSGCATLQCDNPKCATTTVRISFVACEKHRNRNVRPSPMHLN
jgi:hypothetical protein